MMMYSEMMSYYGLNRDLDKAEYFEAQPGDFIKG
jgi:hypothetical protein